MKKKNTVSFPIVRVEKNALPFYKLKMILDPSKLVWTFLKQLFGKFWILIFNPHLKWYAQV